MQDLIIYDDLITSLITLKLILDNIDKISKVIKYFGTVRRIIKDYHTKEQIS